MCIFEPEDLFIWNDNMCIAENEAWFVGCVVNALFKLNIKSGQYEMVIDFPDYQINVFRKNQVGIKYGKYILCFPDKGKFIWIYDTIENKLTKIDAINSGNIRIRTTCVFNIDNKIYAVASGLKQIIKIEINSNVCIEYYSLFDDAYEGELGEESVCIGQYIYCSDSKTNIICEFNVNTKKCRYYSIPGIVGGITTMCYDGEYFWLTGYNKEIYVWNKEINQTNVINNFPKECGSYEIDEAKYLKVNKEKIVFDTQVFYRSINAKENIWFIPYQCNHILYIDKCNYKLNIMELPDEVEDTNSWNRGMQHKYLVEGVMAEDNIIFLYSMKNEAVIELNMENKEYQYKYYYLREQDKQRIWELFHKNDKLIIENRDDDLYYFKKAAKRQGLKEVLAADAIGGKIHRFITK